MSIPAEKPPPVVCFAGDDYWSSNPHSRYHFMHALHRRGHRVLWVSSIGMNLPRLRSRGFFRRVFMRLRSWSRWLRPAVPGFDVLTPIALPLFGNKVLEAVNDAWITGQVRLAYRLCGIRKPLVFASLPSFARTVLGLPNSGLIYYYSDKYDAYRDLAARQAIVERDAALFAAADAVFCVSRKIHDELKAKRPGVFYLPHAVDLPHFERALADDRPPPPDIAAIPRPRIGYYGSVDDGHDLPIIERTALAHPDWQFVFIGRKLGDFSSIEKLPNVHFLGFKPYAEIGRYGKEFDVGFMVWKRTEWIQHCSPLKAKEYLSLGLPTISVHIDELTPYSDVIALVKTGAEFEAAIAQALQNDCPDLRARRRDRVQDESWDARAEEMLAAWQRSRVAAGRQTPGQSS